jgi:hypothetical protein
MMENVGSAVGSDVVAGGLAGRGAGGIVSRPRLFERLAPARVSVVAAPAGSGKTVLLRSWIGDDDLTDCAAWVPTRRPPLSPWQIGLNCDLARSQWVMRSHPWSLRRSALPLFLQVLSYLGSGD